MKIGLYVEGPTDAAFYQPLVCRVLRLETSDIIVRIRRGVCIKGLKISLESVLKEFRLANCTHWALAADRHEATAAEASQIAQKITEAVQGTPCSIGVAVMQLEAWLLADYRTLGRVMGKPDFQKPPKVEEIEDPKRYIQEHFGYLPTLESLAQMAQEIDLEIARKESRSFDRFIKDLEAWRQASSQAPRNRRTP